MGKNTLDRPGAGAQDGGHDRSEAVPGPETGSESGQESGQESGMRTGKAPAREPGVRFLAVGDMTPPPTATGSTANGDRAGADITCLPFAEVTAEALARIRPDVVFSSLVGPGFDCLDLAERLAAAGFRGQYRAVAPKVPDPDLVRREITDRFPELDFDLVVLAERG